jgi:hypothetical protein
VLQRLSGAVAIIAIFGCAFMSWLLFYGLYAFAFMPMRAFMSRLLLHDLYAFALMPMRVLQRLCDVVLLHSWNGWLCCAAALMSWPQNAWVA